jgi:DEAD/DEAH box helicase domain-containing protein
VADSLINVDDIVNILTRCGLPPQESIPFPGKLGTHLPIPEGLPGQLSAALAKYVGTTTGLYSHQAKAIQAVLDDTDVCLATPTASGKSLVFMTAAVEIFIRDSRHRTLAVYPNKALIQDQMEKWEQFTSPFGMKVGFIDGSVPTASRQDILAKSHVVAMTPDVAHAWMMSNLGKKEVARFLAALRLLVLDEAHVYDGAFGTNMAYFLRRLATAAAPYRVICSTATIGEPASFMKQLTGRDVMIFGLEDDGSSV